MNRQQNDLQHIRQMMERSSTFLSLSGLSGIGAGIFALLGCAAGFYILHEHQIDYFDGKPNVYTSKVTYQIAAVALLTLVLSLASAIYFTVKKSKRLQLPLWSLPTKNILKAGMIPLVAGGIFCIILTINYVFYLVAPCMLIFYGLALTSAAKYTNDDIFWLGICQLTLGLVAAVIPGYGLVFWGIGFGLLHIAYGWYMFKKYQ
ncbi:MAG: hypothetical protein WAU01_03910 [Saprospiraceae bacterium]